LGRFMELATRLPHLQSKGSGGLFLENGSRLYLDTGNHPELATPEVVNPWDACRYVLAGERVLAELAGQLVADQDRIEQVFLTSCNVAYGGVPTTWACHESYGHRGDPLEMPQKLIPHLVSRVIFTGAGGFNNKSAGLEFMLSPRVAHLCRVSSADSQNSRGIYHEKDESLSCEGFHRLHVLVGESLCSETSAWLKVATTALVVAMIEAGLLGDRTFGPQRPLAAMGRFAADVDCKARVRGYDHRYWTALQLQRHYLERAEAHVDDPVMPPWAPQACCRWRAILDRLEHAPHAVEKTLDWAIKLSLYRSYAAGRGIDWDSLPHWSYLLVRLDKALQKGRRENGRRHLTADVLGPNSPVADEVARLTPYLEQKGLRWDQLEAVLALRRELFEIDTRFGQLGGQGIFAELDRAGVLEHHVDGVDNIEHAIANPPATGRALLRGRCVRQFHSRGPEYRCDWRGVWDFREGRFLDLSDPLTTQENWIDVSDERAGDDESFPRFLTTVLRQAFSYYRRGHFGEAHGLLERIRPVHDLFDFRSQLDFLRLSAWVAARRGLLDGERYLDQLPESRRESLWGILDYVSVFRFRGLAPSPETSAWIRKGLDRVAAEPDGDPQAKLALFEHHGYLLMSEGRLDEARDLLEETCRFEVQSGRTLHVLYRAKAILGEVRRRLGSHDEAQRLLEEVRAGQTENRFRGDMADFTLTYLAKLQTDRTAARSMLADVKRIQAGADDLMGMARTLLLEARLSEGGDEASAIQSQVLDLKAKLPALAQCRLLGNLLQKWDLWAGADLSPDKNGDLFWGV